MRVFLLISARGRGISIMERIAQEGHRAIVYVNNYRDKTIGDGRVEKHKTKDTLVSLDGEFDRDVLLSLLYPTPDCVIFDEQVYGFGIVADEIRKTGIPVFGTSIWEERVSLEEKFNNKVIKTLGIGGEEVNDVSVQISTEAWFNGVETLAVVHAMEERKLMEGGKGPGTSGMGSVVWIGRSDSRLYDLTIGKLIPLLKKINYRGVVGVDAVVGEKGVSVPRILAGLRFGSIFPLLEMYRGKVNDLIYGMAAGVLREMKFKASLGVGVTLAVLPFPILTGPNLYSFVPITGLNQQNLKHFWGVDVCKKGDSYLVSGNGGEIGHVTARGDEIEGFSQLRDAKRRVMRTINNLSIPDVMYRLDIGNRVEGDRSKLKTWGMI